MSLLTGLLESDLKPLFHIEEYNCHVYPHLPRRQLVTALAVLGKQHGGLVITVPQRHCIVNQWRLIRSCFVFFS